jgi:hypothetical protein
VASDVYGVIRYYWNNKIKDDEMKGHVARLRYEESIGPAKLEGQFRTIFLSVCCPKT